MRFRDVLDALGLDATAAAELFGVQPQTIRQMRLDPDRDGFRSPPDGWEVRLAAVARTRGEEMAQMADQLEKGG